MERAVDNVDLGIDHRITAQRPVLGRLDDALADRADELPGNPAAHNIVLNDNARAPDGRSHLQDDMAILAATAGLLNLLPFPRGGVR